MKKYISIALLAIIAIFTIIGRTNATTVDVDPSRMVITLKNGSVVTYEASQLDSVVYIGGTWGTTDGMAMKVYVKGASASTDYLFSQITDISTEDVVITISAPSFSQESGSTFTQATSITISTATTGATVYYTTDGTEPSASNYANSGTTSVTVNVSETMTIKAIAIKDGYSSSVATATYTVQTSTDSSDVFTLVTDASTLQAGMEVIFVSLEADAGVSAMTSSTASSKTMGATTTGFSINTGQDEITLDSSSDVAVFTLEGSAGAWKIEHDGNYLWAQSSTASLTLSSDNSSYTHTISIADNVATVMYGSGTRCIRYNYNDGTNPRFGTYVSTYKAVSIYARGEGSGTVTTVDAPTFSQATGATFTAATDVTISTTTTGATVYYTTDGTTPSASNYAGSGTTSVTVNVNETMTVKAIAIKDGVSSSVATATYTVSSGSSSSDEFTLVTDASTLQAGMEVIFVSLEANAGVSAMTSNTISSTLVATTSGFSINSSNDEITLDSSSDVAGFTLEGTSGAWKFNTGDNYLYVNGGTNSVTINSTNSSYTHTISISSNNATITDGSGSRVLMYNYNNGTSPRFGTYLTSFTSGKAVQIFARGGSGSTTTTVKAPTFSRTSGSAFTNTTTSVTITTATTGATVYYTTDGTTPSATNYAGSGTTSVSLTITASMTVKAIAIKDGVSSAVATATYTVKESSVDPTDNNKNRNSLSSYYNKSKYMYNLEWPHIKEDSNQSWSVRSTTDYGVSLQLEWDNSLIANRYTCYQMHSGNMVRNVSRKDAFATDTEVTNSSKASDYSGSGFSRGHLCPSADRRASQEANSHTFLYTNMQPEYQTHNGGSWGTLEDAIRGVDGSTGAAPTKGWYCNFDTLYVVKAATIDNLTIGGKTVSGVKSVKCNNRLPVPEYFYMALLGYNKSTNSYTAVALWSKHDENDDVAPVYMTIDKLEEITGIDFFCNLPDDIEEAVESTVDTSKWTATGQKEQYQLTGYSQYSD